MNYQFVGSWRVHISLMFFFFSFCCCWWCCCCCFVSSFRYFRFGKKARIACANTPYTQHSRSIWTWNWTTIPFHHLHNVGKQNLMRRRLHQFTWITTKQYTYFECAVGVCILVCTVHSARCIRWALSKCAPETCRTRQMNERMSRSKFRHSVPTSNGHNRRAMQTRCDPSPSVWCVQCAVFYALCWMLCCTTHNTRQTGP